MNCPNTTTAGKCPLEPLLRSLAGPWTLYILWVLGNQGASRFGALNRSIEGISTKVLTERLRSLEGLGFIYRHYEPTVPPQVTYGLTDRGQELMGILDQLYALAEKWEISSKGADELETPVYGDRVKVI